MVEVDYRRAGARVLDTKYELGGLGNQDSSIRESLIMQLNKTEELDEDKHYIFFIEIEAIKSLGNSIYLIRHVSPLLVSL